MSWNWHNSPPLFVQRLSLALLLLCYAIAGHADDEERRIAVGGRLFTAMLAANPAIAEHQSTDGKLHLLIIYQSFPRHAVQLARRLNQDTMIREIPVSVEVVEIDEISAERLQQVAGVFIAERITRPLPRLIELCRDQQIILFSPFTGDVERGVTGGLSISDRILPYVNLRAMESAGLELKPFFLRIADHYE